MTSCLLALLWGIPDVVWAALVGAIVGAVTAWVGVYLQQCHDSKEREKERQASLRRDVYLFGMKEIGHMLQYLGNFSTATELGPLEYSAAIQQMQIVGTDETVHATIRLNDYIVQSFCDLAPEKEGIDYLHVVRKNLGHSLQQNMKDVDRWLEWHKQLLLQKEFDSAEMTIIKNALDSAIQRGDEIVKKLRDNLYIEHECIGELAKKCWERTQEAERLLVPCVVAIRKEIDMPLDEKAYQQVLKVSEAQWKKNVETYIAAQKANRAKLLNTLVPEDHSDPEPRMTE